MSKPIETRYGGCRFRSRIEARWAVFFDTLNVPWEYEKQGYDLDSDGWYLPDFWLEDQQCWVEVKGAPPTAVEIRKAEALREATDSPVVIVHGRVDNVPHTLYAYDTTDSAGGSNKVDGNWCMFSSGRFAFATEDQRRDRTWFADSAFSRTLPWVIQVPRLPFTAGAERAYDAALSARFEHGENGRRR